MTPENHLQLSEPELKEAEERSSVTVHVVHEAVRREGEEELKRTPAALWWSGLAAGDASPCASGGRASERPGLQSRSMVTGIEHTAIASPNPERLAQWYVETLGFTINYRATGSRALFLKAPDGSMIEVIEAAGPASGSVGMSDPGLRHMALAVADFPEACRKLREHGVSFLGEPWTKSGNSVMFFLDFDGNILHLLHRETPLP